RSPVAWLPDSLRAAAEKRLRAQRRGLVGLAEIVEGGERFVGIFTLAQLEGIEADALHEEEVVARDLTHGAHLPLVAITLAKDARNREAAAVAELGEVDLDARHAGELIRHLGRIVGGLEPYDFLVRRRRA